MKRMNLSNRCLPSGQAAKATSGNILSHCREQTLCLRENIGLRLFVFKIGVSANPITRYLDYLDLDQGYQTMWLIAVSPRADLIHTLEAALVMEFHKHVGCRNKEGSGGEGALNKKRKAPPPCSAYVTGGRADQLRRVG